MSQENGTVYTSARKREADLLFAQRANVERYRRLLRTNLTETERAFVERRVAEEQAAREKITARVVLDVVNSYLQSDRQGCSPK